MPARRLLFGGLLVVCSCAQVREITGGEKDIVPPKLVSATPPIGSVRFNNDVIFLEFDERIQLDRVRDRLLISPPLDVPPEVRITGANSVQLKLLAPLKANTTYTFNLGDCVKDLTEGNTAPGLAYVISTGDALDSLHLAGAVVNAFTGLPEKDMLVILHDATDTSDFRTARPGYMTRCDALGVFSIGNLPQGAFVVRALRDKNANYRYDLPNEEIAFLDTNVVLSATDSISHLLLLRAFLPTSPEQQVRSVGVTTDGALQLVLSRPATALTLKDVARTGGTLTWSPEWSAMRDTVLLWPSDTTLVEEGSYQVSDPEHVIDTVRYRAVKRMPFNTGAQVNLVEENPNAFIRIRTSRPIRELDSTFIELTRDSLPLAYHVERDTVDERTIRLITQLPAGASAKLVLYPKAIRDIYGGTNDTLRVPLGRAAEQATGSLRVNVTGLPKGGGQYLLHLLDGQQRVIARAALSGESTTTTWQRLPPGLVTLGLIADGNGNGRWDTGEWSSHLQPERTWRYPESVNVRAAWDVVVDWKPE